MSASPIGRKSVLAAIAVLAAGSSASADSDGSAHGRKRVIELFTSQGCSSCPPADALLEKYKTRDDTIVLSFPVDYWDRLGWKDTFGSRENSDRQRAYAVRRGDHEIYTPQVVVDGRAHSIGSVRTSIDSVLSSTKADVEAARVSLKATREGGSLIVSVGGAARRAGSETSGRLLLAAVQDSGTVAIGRGENSGRKITYHNVVRSLRDVGSWNGSGTRMRVELTPAETSCCSSVVLLLQQPGGGPVLAADQINLQ